MYVIGTAGHVDHGKSSLVKALTGINPDRLREEQSRQMTIELGFAWLNLPNGKEIGIIDVPGHRDFIDNMLAGVGGIDAVLFVIASDEGVMPQTREHLAIIDLLKIPRGIVIISKADLTPDSEWIELLTLEIREFLAGTVLQNSPIIPFSIHNIEDREKVISELEHLFQDQPEHRDLNKPRIWIDRVFTISGFGTVITGTLQDGIMRIGDELEILPTGLKTRVRGLQTHKKEEQQAVPGSRVAVNLTGVKTDQIERGYLLSKPGTYKPTKRVDALIEMLPDAAYSINHDDVLKLHIGSAQVSARVRVIGGDTISAGSNGWAQLEFDKIIPVDTGDRFILRWPSPGATIAGGRILASNPLRRYRRFHSEIKQMFEQLERGSPQDRMLHALANTPQEPSKVRSLIDLDDREFDRLVAELKEKNHIFVLGDEDNGLIASKDWVSRYSAKTRDIVAAYHTRYPLRPGLPREELKNKLELPSKLFNAFYRYLSIYKDNFRINPEIIALENFRPEFSESQKKQIDLLLNSFNQKPYKPPSVKECIDQIGEEAYHTLLSSGTFTQVSEDVVFTSGTFEEMKSEILMILKTQHVITLAQVRDHFNTSRKYALAVLENLDEAGITKRNGDNRRLSDQH